MWFPIFFLPTASTRPPFYFIIFFSQKIREKLCIPRRHSRHRGADDLGKGEKSLLLPWKESEEKRHRRFLFLSLSSFAVYMSSIVCSCCLYTLYLVHTYNQVDLTLSYPKCWGKVKLRVVSKACLDMLSCGCFFSTLSFPCLHHHDDETPPMCNEEEKEGGKGGETIISSRRASLLLLRLQTAILPPNRLLSKWSSWKRRRRRVKRFVVWW